MDIAQGLEVVNTPGFSTRSKLLRCVVMTKGATVYYVPVKVRMKGGQAVWGRDREYKIARVR